MFQNTTHLPQRLENKDYYCPDRFQEELKAFFLKGWQFLGDTTQVKKDGDFFTRELYGHPLICWFRDGRYEVFLNVCSHRLCTITDKANGRFDGRMKCQYHGWEFDGSGKTCKIPDAQSFRPLTKDLVRLKKFPVATVGKLIFISFEEDPPPLNEFLGQAMYDRCADWFGDRYIPAKNFDEVVDCNWKIVMENVLESYHIETVHHKTFKEIIRAEDVYNKFYEFGTEQLLDYREWGADRHMEWAINRCFGTKPTYDWWHIVRYPNIVIAKSSLVTYIQSAVPLSPSKTDNMFRAFSYAGPKPSLRNFLSAQILRQGARRFIGNVLAEDVVVYPGIQRGVSAADWPCGGLISIREERIFEFQEYVLRQLNRTEELGASERRSLAKPFAEITDELLTSAPPVAPPEA